MDWKKKYETALERAKAYHSDLTRLHHPREVVEDIFPELAESEDERIIDFLIAYFSKGIWETSYPFSPLEIRNWLEKQKEQKSAENNVIIPKFHTGDYIKPKAYNEEHLIKDINKKGYVLDVDMIIPFKDEDVWELSKQKPAEWSEEDEIRLDSIISSYRELLQDYKACHDVDYIPYTSDTLIRNVVDDIGFLRSLSPQPHWKPSEEQMEALKNSAYGTYQNGDGPALRELYEQLKKLM